QILPLTYHSKIPVIQNTDCNRKFLYHCCGEFLGIHLESAVPADGHHFSSRIANRRANGGREAVSHGSQSSGRQKLSLSVKFQKLSRPHLILSYVRCNNRLIKELIDCFDNLLRNQLFFFL